MQNVPKIVRDRLKAAAPAVDHPDADALAAFAERSLLEKERAIVLEHLARCGDCRDIVALALPASEPVEAAIRLARSGWLTWPALRWGFVAAGVVAIASFGLLQYQRRPAMTAVKQQSTSVEVAANEPKKSVTPFVAGAPTERVAPAAAGKKDERQSPSAPAFADSFYAANPAVDEKKSNTRAQTAPTHVQTQTRSQVAARITGNSSGYGGPRVANQWPQQNMIQNQAPAPAAPNQFAKQQAAGGDMSANMRVPTVNQTVEVSAGAPAIATESTSEARQGQSQPATQPPSGESLAFDTLRRAKPAVPQGALGQIGGYVVDPTGAVVSNARITITPSKTGASATAVTNSQGAWLIAGLPSGAYKAQAEARGFKTTILDFNYDANHPSTYSLALSPGSVSETVEVSSAEAQVQTTGANVGGLITGGHVSQIPASGRDFTQLATVVPMPRWTINAAGALQRSFDQGNSWQTVDVYANAGASGANFAMAAAPSPAKAKEADKTLKRDVAVPTFRAVAATGSDVWAGGSAGALYHSADAGNHWTRVVPASAGAILTGDIMSLEFADIQHGRVSTSTSELWITNDGGQTWQKQ